MPHMYYLVYGTLRDGLSYPFERTADKQLAERERKCLIAQKLPALVMTAGEYRDLTGRTAATDYQKELDREDKEE